MVLAACAMMTGALANGDRPQLLPEIELMPKVKGQWVSESMTLNGVPATVRAFKGPVRVDAVVAYYERLWQDSEGVVTRRRKEWHIVATKQDGRFVSLHVRADGRGSEGMIVVSADPAEYLDAPGTKFPLPPEIHVLSRQSFFDAGMLAETITLRGKGTVTEAAMSMESQLARANWQLISRGPASTHHDAVIMEFRRDKDHARIFVARDRQWGSETFILVTWRRN